MKKKWIVIVALTWTVALSGCGWKIPFNERPPASAPSAVPTVATEPVASAIATVPTVAAVADGNPNDVTCKGSYTASGSLTQPVAFMGENELTVGQLQGYYWAEVAQYRQAHPADGPDWNVPLDIQPCGISSGVNSWQQYFLNEALDAWHTAQALVQHSLDTPIETEDAYQPNQEDHAKYLTDIPATKFLYGYSDRYQRNTMHQAYLDALSETLDALAREKGYSGAADMAENAFGTSLADLQSYAERYNEGYMYLTELSYDIQLTQQDVEDYSAAHNISQNGGHYVNIRHILLIPAADGTGEQSAVTIGPDGSVDCTEEQWSSCMQEAQKLLSDWKNKERGTEAAFADIAHKRSQDTATSLDGGSLTRISQGQLIPELDSWCFGDGREPGDTEIIRTDYGVCILYYAGSTPIWYAEAEDALYRERQTALMEQIKERYPMTVDFKSITLAPATADVSSGDILYPDVAHERYPEIPLYLQQDYPSVRIADFSLRTCGCGITSMSMLATYMSDQALTPPVMVDRYSSYCSASGTDGSIFIREPASMGFYLLRRSFEPDDVLEALKQGYVVVSVHQQGYWTSAGHYIVIEKLNEDGTVQVRDSNIFNYNNSFRAPEAGHLVDRHSWASVTSSSTGYWIFDYKVTHVPACRRCGQIEQTNSHILTQDYICEKCRPALLRRENYLENA